MKIYQALNAIMSDLGAIEKERQNTHQKYQFRGIEDMYNAIHPLLVKHKVIVVPNVLERELLEYQRPDKISFRAVLKVCHSFTSCEDFSKVDVITLGEGIDTSDKAINKAMSGAMKYAFTELFSIPTKDIDDADQVTPEIENAPRAAPIAPVKKQSFAPSNTITDAQAKRLFTIATSLELSHEQVKNFLKSKFNLDSSKGITKDIYESVIQGLYDMKNAQTIVNPNFEEAPF